MRSLLGRFHRPNARSQSEQLFMLNNLGDGSTLSLDFTTGVLDPRLTFTRSTTGTYINSSGYVTSAAINAPRFDYDPTALTPRGLLIEGSASNLVTRSQTLNQAAWLKAATTISETGTGSPANDATSNLLTWTNGTAVGSAYTEQSSLAVSASQPYTWSVWLKNRGNQRVSVFGFTKTSTNTFSGNLEMTVDFSVATPTATITTSTNFTSTSVTTPVAFGNGWYRCTMTGTTPSTAAVTGFGISNKDAVPASGTNGCEVWGAQLEAGSGASSYIPTGASQGSRAADSCVMTGTNFSSWFAGATEGVLYAECERPTKIPSPATDHAIVGTRYANGQGLWIYASATNQYPSAYIFPTGGAQFAGGIATLIPLINKQAVRWFDGNDITNFGSGTQGTTNTAGTGTMVPTMLTIGANSTSGTEGNLEWLNGCIRRVKFWPTALPNAQIIALTT